MTAVLHAFGSIKVHISLLTDLPYGKASMSYAVPAKRVEQPEQVAHPERHHNDDHDIQYRFDGRLHGNEAVHNPKQHAHCDECNDNIDEWQEVLLSSHGAHGHCGFLIRRTWPRSSIQPVWLTSRRRLHWCEQLQRSPSETSASNPAQGLHPRGEHEKSDGCHRLPAWSLHPAERQRHRD